MNADRRWLFVVLLIAVCSVRTGAWQAACDRACLTRIADEYFAAMVAHDPKKAPLAPNVRFTEQTQVKPVGDGLWKTASEAPTTFKIYVADPVVGQLGGIVMMKDAGKPIQLTPADAASFHHPMNEKVLTLAYPDGTRGTRDMMNQRQFDMAASHIIKVRDRRIHEIEASGAVLPFNSKNGWSDFLR